MVSSTFSVVHAWYGATEADQHTEHATFGTVRDLVERKCVVGNELVVPSSLSGLLGATATILAVLVRTETGEDFHLRFQDGQGGTWSPAVEGVVVVNAAEAHVDPCDWASDDDRPAAAAADDEDDDAAAGKPVLGHEVVTPPPDAAPMEVVFAWYGIEGGLMSTKKIADYECGTVLDVVRDAFLQGGDKTRIVVPPNLNTFFGDPVPNAYKVLAVHVRNTVTGADQHLRFHEHVGGSWSFADGPNHANARNASPRWKVIDGTYGSKAHPFAMDKFNRVVSDVVQSLFGGDQVLRIQPQLHAYFGHAPGVSAVRAILRFSLVRTTDESERYEFAFRQRNIGTVFTWDGTTKGVSCCIDDDDDDDTATAARMEVVFAWYGFEGGPSTTSGSAHYSQASVSSIIAAHFLVDSGTRLCVPPNLNTFFGDPVPNAYKVLAVHVRNTVTGADQHLRFHEHVGGSWSFADGPNHANAHNATPRWVVVNASYPTPATKMGKCNVATAAIVQSLFGGDEVLRIQHAFFAYFGNTSAPGGRRVLRVDLVDRESGAPTQLKFVEGTAVEWDGTTTPPVDQAAIQLRVVDAEDLSEVYFKIKPVTPLRKLFDAYCLRRGIPRSSGRFLYLGAQIDNDATTSAELGLRGDNHCCIEFQKKDRTVSTIPTTAIIDAWYGHPTDPSKRNAEPKVAHTIDQHFFNANDRSVIRVPAHLNRHFGDPAPNVVKVLSFTVCVTGAPDVYTLLFKEHEGGEVSVTSPESMAPFRTSTAPSTAELHARIAAEKRENAALHEELAAMRAA